MANSNAKVSLKTLDDGYALIVDGEESEEVGYGDVLEMTTSDGRRFIALADCEGKDVITMTEFWAYEALPVVDVPIIEADEDEEDEDEDGLGDDDEDDDEVGEPEEAEHKTV
jgi:hypothetical protein